MPARWTFTDDERFRIAVHEVGHALIGHLLQPGNVQAFRVESFRSEGQTSVELGGTKFKHFLPVMPVEQDFHVRITVLLGGLVAEQLILGGHSTSVGESAASDLAQVTRLASTMEMLFGFGDSLISHLDGEGMMDRLPVADAGIRRAVKARLQTCRLRAVELLEPERETIRSIARVLADELEMSAERFSELVEAREATVPVLRSGRRTVDRWSDVVTVGKGPADDVEDPKDLADEPSFGEELDIGVDRPAVGRRIVTPGTTGPKLKRRLPLRPDNEEGT